MIPQRGRKNLRKGRFSQTGSYYFLTTATKGREPFFETQHLADAVLQALKWLETRNRIEIYTAVLMPDHLHLIAELKSGTLAGLMKSLKGFSAREINKRLGRTGPIWDEQYYDRAIRNERELHETAKNVLDNPVRKGIVDDFARYPHVITQFTL